MFYGHFVVLDKNRLWFKLFVVFSFDLIISYELQWLQIFVNMTFDLLLDTIDTC